MVAAKRFARRRYGPRGKYSRWNQKATKKWWHKPARSVAGLGIDYLKKQLGLNTENKDWDSTLSVPTSATMTPVYFPMSNIAQGTTNNTRNGNGIRCTHFKFRGSIATVGPANVSFQRVRVIWTLQKQVTTPGAFVTAAELMQNTLNIDSPYNSDLENVKVISDKTFLIKPNTAQIAQLPYKFKWNPSYTDGHVRWTDADTLGLGVNETQGLLQMFIITDQLANFPVITGYGRVHFVDN